MSLGTWGWWHRSQLSEHCHIFKGFIEAFRVLTWTESLRSNGYTGMEKSMTRIADWITARIMWSHFLCCKATSWRLSSPSEELSILAQVQRKEDTINIDRITYGENRMDKGKGKVVPVLNYLSTTPWKIMGVTILHLGRGHVKSEWGASYIHHFTRGERPRSIVRNEGHKYGNVEEVNKEMTAMKVGNAEETEHG